MFNFILDRAPPRAQDLTMVKKEPVTGKGEETRRLIFQSALELFRSQGFDATTMQQIAEHAQVAKSAAYYYFPSKESLITAYYETVQAAQESMCAEAFAASGKLSVRLRVAMQSKFDLAQNDRNLLGVVFRNTGEPQHPLSCLGPATADIRRRSMQVFHDAIAEEKLPRDLRELLPLALWSLQMGLLILFLYDGSKGQQRTRRLADGSLELTVKLLGLAKLPLLMPVRKKILALLQQADLMPEVLP
jgi:AcrR family transcriptional regulator